VKRLGADGNFRAQAKLSAIVKAGTGVDQHGGGVDFVSTEKTRRP